MKRWKKWAALAITLCCLPISSLPAYADEETSGDDPAQVQDADADTNAEDAEEEGTREEPVEEIEITADQVRQYMEEKNSFEGITFYYRPEDYEDTIADEDVVDLLDDIELAGIDDETGEVVCTLEEEDDTDAFVIFLSEEGRWLVYMDP